MEKGSVDVRLGGGLFKQRVAMEGQGKSGGWRTLLGFRAGDRAVFLYVFAKAQRDNVSPKEARALRMLAKQYLALAPEHLDAAVATGALEEVTCDGKG